MKDPQTSALRRAGGHLVMTRLFSYITAIFIVILCFPFPLRATQPIIKNGDFENGDLSGWTVFTTPNGTLGGVGFPDCVEFDVTGDGVPTKSLTVKVGQQDYQADGAPLAGGGVETTVGLTQGRAIVTADIASSYSSPTDRRNLAGGLFEILLDGNVIAHHDFGPIENGVIQRFTLKGATRVSAGRHEVRVRVRRPFRSMAHDQAPRQFIDNIHLHLSAQ